MSLPLIELFHIGPQKSGTTWVFHALKGHPGVCPARRDSVHYFDMFHARGRSWLEGQFPDYRAGDGRKLLDATPSYLRSPRAARFIAEENPKSKIVLCLRDPIERAFSHYWHEKKKGKYRFSFEEVLENYDLFSAWIEPGFYADALERVGEYFPREQVLCQDFGLLQRDSAAFLRELLVFCDLDVAYEPESLNRKVNAAGGARNFQGRLAKFTGKLTRWIPGIERTDFGKWSTGRGEYERGVAVEVRKQLEVLVEPEIVRVEKMLGRTFPEWRRGGV